MTPLIRLHSLALATTTLIVFYLWQVLAPIEFTFSGLKIPLAAVSSIGIYRSFLVILKFLILNVRIIKKWAFGAYYFEGVWIGFYIGRSGKERYYIEIFEQDFDSLVIRGKAFRENEGYFGFWISENPNIDIKKGTLTYTYQSDAISDSFINSGLAHFIIDRKKITAAPHGLTGFSADIYSAKKLRSHEIKISDKPEVEDDMVALKAAKQLFKANEDIKLIMQV